MVYSELWEKGCKEILYKYDVIESDLKVSQWKIQKEYHYKYINGLRPSINSTINN